jgi:raffinose/stachyose/melibiose transport system substrate-binding protein
VLPVAKGAETALTDANLTIVSNTLAAATGFQLFLDQALPPAIGQQINDSVAALIAGSASPQQVGEQITRTAKSQ